MKKETMDLITLIIASGGIFFSAVAAIAAWRSAALSSKQLKDQKVEHERLEKPRLVPLNTLISPHVSSVLSDWQLPKTVDGMVEQKGDELINKNFIPLPNLFSNVKIPMINAGGSFAIDVTYSLTLVSDVAAIDDYKSPFAKIELHYSSERKNNDSVFSLAVFNHESDKEQYSSNQLFLVSPHLRHISIIESGKKEEIFVPSYFVALCNIYFIESYANSFGNKPLKMNKPSIKLVIDYVDQYYKKHCDEYLMELSTKQFESASYHPRFEAWIDFTYIEPKKSKKQK